MSIGNPKKPLFSKDFKLKEISADIEDITLVHKDKNHRVKKELSFKTKNNKSKLA